jgi:hypothetical protein
LGVRKLASIAYFILAYKEPERTIRLVNRLHTPSDYFYVHFGIDVGKQSLNEWKQMMEQNCQTANVKITSEFLTKRGSFDSVAAPLAAMRYYKDFNYDYFVNLTGECYPLRHPNIIKKEFSGQTKGFMEFFELPSKVWSKGGMERLEKKFYSISIGKYYKLIRVPRLGKKIPCNLKPYGGSAAFCLHRDFINYLLEFLDSNPKVFKFFRHAGYADEVFFQTILMNSPLKTRIVNDDKRYIDWGKSRCGHPMYLTIQDFSKMIESKKLFARKFSLVVDKNILDLLDKKMDEESLSSENT